MKINMSNVKSIIAVFIYPSVLLTMVLFFSVLSIRLYSFYKTGVFETVLFDLFCESAKNGFSAGSIMGAGLLVSMCFFSKPSGKKEK